ncbi:MAG: N-6 DNA methylase, partial [Thermoguttaceae bacterium]|nr:N-6 DNA methylase [Thermoguttaceae bacterium]
MSTAVAERPVILSARSSQQAIDLEGGLFGPDILERLETGSLPGQSPRDFLIKGGRSVIDEVADIYRDACDLWGIFTRRLIRLAENESDTALTRKRWVIPFLELLGYDLEDNQKAYQLGDQCYSISHRAGKNEDAPPIHIVGARQELGRVDPHSRPRLSPHALMQEFLNRSEYLWGIVTNGRVLRLLRKSTLLRRQAYVEFDLAAIFEAEGDARFSEFVLLYRLLHRTRLPQGIADGPQCWLERYHQEAIEQGNRARDHLRDGVEKCLQLLGTAFLRAYFRQEATSQGEPTGWRNNADRKASGKNRASSDDGALASRLYTDLLRLVYRFLFLLVAEERGVLTGTELYRRHYSISRLRRLVDRLEAYTDHEDLCLSLRVLWRLLQDDGQQSNSGQSLARLLGLTVLDGHLFEPIDIDNLVISNRELLEAFYYLSYYYDPQGRTWRRVNYAALDVEELGSVYESLLDNHPEIIHEPGGPIFRFLAGSERKSTGSYYTPPELVQELIKSALEPVVKERLAQVAPAAKKAARQAQPARHDTEKLEKAILSLRIIDPACGSGHFLLAAARYLGKELARIRTGEDEPAPEALREAIRDVVTHSVYGVDKNPLAVELCRVALWIESHSPGKPLTFLDHRIKCGDSLVGVFDLEVLRRGIPDEAFEPVTGDDKELARTLKRANRAEREDLIHGQMRFNFSPADKLAALTQTARQLEAIPDDSPENIRRKKDIYERLEQEAETLRTACDLWTAAFFQERSRRIPSEALITTDTLSRWLEGQPVPPQALAEAKALAHRLRFFHWPLEFPEVFIAPKPPADGLTPSTTSPLSQAHKEAGTRAPNATKRGGFDVVLCNPPWERIKIQREEFFAQRDSWVASAANKSERDGRIEEIKHRNPNLCALYLQALHDADCLSKFLRESKRFPLTARGDINTYSVFCELFVHLLSQCAYAGTVVPSGIATDATNQHFFNALSRRGQLASLFDFENRRALFPAIHRSYKFCLLTLRSEVPTAAEAGPMASPEKRSPSSATFAFFLTSPDEIRDPRRQFTLSPEDLALLNPNTRTCPIFRTVQDAELTKAIYRRVPVLVNEVTNENPWNIRFLRMFDMALDSRLFRTRDNLKQQGFRLMG